MGFAPWVHQVLQPSRCLIFALQHGQQLYRHVYLGCKEEDNIHKNFELLYTSLALITIELANEEVVTDLIRLAIALQVCGGGGGETHPSAGGIVQHACVSLQSLSSLCSHPHTLLCPLPQDTAILNEDNLPMFSRCSIMALVAAYLNFLSQMIAVPAFCQHVSKVCGCRMSSAFLLSCVLGGCSALQSVVEDFKNSPPI